MIEQIKKYFAEKGGPMSLQEYKYAEDAPIKLNVLKAKIGSWGRVLKMAGAEVTVSVTVEHAEEAPAVVKPEAAPVVEETPAPAPVTKATAKTKGA